MSKFAPKESSLAPLESKVIVLTGGAAGIGATTVRLLHSLGAYIVFGDVDALGAQTLISSLPNTPYPRSNVTFRHTDVRSYNSNLELFELAEEKYNRVDHAIANAGVAERGDWFGSSLNRDTVSEQPTEMTMQINLMGMIYFARIAVAFLDNPKTRTPGDDRSIVIMSSSAGIVSCPMVFYGASKHGALGLAKGLAAGPGLERGIRVNAVMPGMTGGTQIMPDFVDAWEKAGLPINSIDDVARVMRELISLPDVKETGKLISIEGGTSWDVADGLDKTADLWWGPGCKDVYVLQQGGIPNATQFTKKPEEAVDNENKGED